MNTRSTRARRRFQPASPVESGSGEAVLERRTAMTGGLSSIGASALISERLPAQNLQQGTRVPPYLITAYGRGVQFRDSASTRVSDDIDRMFDSFTTDYLQAQAAYLASPTIQARTVFEKSTTQRVNLLAQQLTQTLVRLPGMLAREKGASAVPLQQFLNRRISNPRVATTLLSTLINSTIPPSNMSLGASEATLYTLTATNAIEAARVATVNASKFATSGIFRQK